MSCNSEVTRYSRRPSINTLLSLESIAYMGFIFCIFCGFWKMYHFCILQSDCTALKTPSALLIHPFLPAPRILGNHGSFYCLRWFPECPIVGVVQHVAFSHWLPSFGNMPLRSSPVFWGLIAHFFLKLSPSPSSRDATDHLSAPLQSDVLVASESQQLWVKLL